MLNILICGTPGTGKTTLVERLKPKLPKFNFINLSQFAIENDCISEYDDKMETHVLDEVKLLQKIEPSLKSNKFNLIESIHSDLLSETTIDWIFVCRTNNTRLYDRLKARSYKESKISNNLEAEIFQTILDEAKETFGSERITELTSNSEKDVETNVKSILERIKLLSDPS